MKELTNKEQERLIRTFYKQNVTVELTADLDIVWEQPAKNDKESEDRAFSHRVFLKSFQEEIKKIENEINNTIGWYKDPVI